MDLGNFDQFLDFFVETLPAKPEIKAIFESG